MALRCYHCGVVDDCAHVKKDMTPLDVDTVGVMETLGYSSRLQNIDNDGNYLVGYADEAIRAGDAVVLTRNGRLKRYQQ